MTSSLASAFPEMKERARGVLRVFAQVPATPSTTSMVLFSGVEVRHSPIVFFYCCLLCLTLGHSNAVIPVIHNGTIDVISYRMFY